MKQTINALTSTRFFAAIMVVIHHFGQEVYPFNKAQKFFHSGNVAVSYFFVLSGFVLCLSYGTQPVSYGEYIKRRIARIAPLYWGALLAFILIAAGFYKYEFNTRGWTEIALSVPFLQAYVPTYPLVLNSPAWSISVEMLFYILFPFLLLLQKKSIRIFTILALVCYAVSQYFHLIYFPIRWGINDNIFDTVFYSPEVHLNQFLFGMLGGYLFSRLQNRALMLKWFTFPVFLLIILLIAFRPENSIGYQVGLLAPVFMLFVLCLAIADPAWLGYRPLVFLGEISYGVYILQFPVYKLLDPLNKQYFHMPVQYLFFVSMVTLILVAALSYLYFERPLRRKINALKWGRSENIR